MSNMDQLISIMKHECCNCGILFWITTARDKRYLETKESFYCPNGHSQSYVGKTDKQKLEDMKKEKDKLSIRLREEQANSHSLDMSVRSHKGQISKLKKKFKEVK